MFDIFKPPRFHIQKRIPQSALTAYLAVETAAEIELTNFTPNQREWALAVVLSAWAFNCAQSGAIDIAHSDVNFIRNAGVNASKSLTPDSLALLETLLESWLDRGLIPSPALGNGST